MRTRRLQGASLGCEYAEQALYDEGLHKDVVVEKESGFGLGAPEEEVALLCDAARLAVVPLDGAAAGLDHSPYSPCYRRFLCPGTALARDHDLKVRNGL